MPRMSICDVNAMTREQYERALGFLFEHSPWVVAQAYDRRPFRDRDDLHAALVSVVRTAPAERQVALIRAHPDLAGREAVAGEMTPASTSEQASAGLNRLSKAEFERFQHLNASYRERFGFPFIVCVREHTRASILDLFERRLGNDEPTEVSAALTEIAKIVRLRLADAVEEAPSPAGSEAASVRITIGQRRFEADLEVERAPVTCAAIRRLLPFRSKIIQARWSGEAAWVPLGDLKVGVPFENHTSHPAPGEILLYPGGYSETEILFPYGATMFACKMGQLAGNHFATVRASRSELADVGRTILWEGAHDLLIEAP